MEYEEYLRIVKQANKYADSYYLKDISLVTDHEYDNIIRSLREFEKHNPNLISNDSPTIKVSNGVQQGFKKVSHIEKMLSIIDFFPGDDLSIWLNKLDGDLFISPKLDGCSLNLLYNNGKLIHGVTRGDGSIGEDVTRNVMEIDSIPKMIPYKGKIEIRGEIVITIEDFNLIVQNMIDDNRTPLSNPRNAAAGTLRQKDSSIVKERNLKFYAWGVGYDTLEYKYHNQVMDFLSKLGFLQEEFFVEPNNYINIQERILYFQSKRKDFPMMLDGVVIRPNNIDNFNKQGMTSKYHNGYIAWKFPAIAVDTELIDVKWTVGRTGVITPIGILKPIEVDNVIISNVTLHNWLYLKELDLRRNDVVSVIRSGDIIPKLVGINIAKRTNEERISIPTHCPSCNSELYSNGTILKCNNDTCRDKVINTIVYFCSRPNLNIEGLNKETITLLYDKGLIQKFIDIYKLTETQLIGLDGFQVKKVNNLLSSINKSKTVTLDKFISSLGIELIGPSAAKIIAKHFNKDWIYKTAEDYSVLKGFGPSMVVSIANFINNNLTDIINLMNILNITYHTNHTNKDHPLYDREIVITGTLSKSRNEYKYLIENYGGIFSNNVSKKTSYLVYNDPNTSKYKKALELDIPVITEENLINMLK